MQDILRLQNRKNAETHGYEKKNQQSQSIAGFFFLVELRGIEPLSENNLTGPSSGAVCYLHSLAEAGTNTLIGLVES